jgi:hypothetical protein
VYVCKERGEKKGEYGGGKKLEEGTGRFIRGASAGEGQPRNTQSGVFYVGM